MKRLFLLIGFLSITMNLLQAQQGIHLGAYAMPLNSWMLNKQDSDASKDTFSYVRTWGMSAGLGIGYQFNNAIGLHLNVLYSTQGQDHTYKNRLQDTVRYQLRQYFLKVPLLFKWNTDPDLKYAFTVELGPQLNYLLGVKERDNDRAYQYDELPFIYKTNVPSRYNTFNHLLIGATLRTGIDAKLRYNLKMNARLWVDYAFNDAENKDANYDQTYQGITTNVKYYPENRPKTTNITAGILIGVTYILIPKMHY